MLFANLNGNRSDDVIGKCGNTITHRIYRKRLNSSLPTIAHDYEYKLNDQFKKTPTLSMPDAGTGL